MTNGNHSTPEGRRRIEVVEYDPTWVDRFEEEATRLRAVFGPALLELHHVGSTSVPGLAAKPTIDIMVEVAQGTDIPTFDPQMAELGYDCRGECLDAPVPGTPGRFYYVRRRGVVHLYHVHVCATGHHEIHEMLCFREYLRGHPRVAAEYGELKQRLSSEFEFDNPGYMHGKDDYVKRVTQAALAWHEQGRSMR